MCSTIKERGKGRCCAWRDRKSTFYNTSSFCAVCLPHESRNWPSNAELLPSARSAAEGKGGDHSCKSPRSPGQVERYMEHTRSDSYDSNSLAYPNKPSESGGATLPEDDTMDGRPEMARTLQPGSVGLGSTDELPEPPRLPRPTTIRPPMVESSSTKTETRRSLMPALAPLASPNSSSSVYVTEHDESPPTKRGLRRLSQAVSTMKLMNKATKLGSATTSDAFLKSRALTRMIGVKGTGHQARGAAPLTCSLRCQWRGLPRATT